MNFVIFPMFFMSTALYPLWKIQESSALLQRLAQYNPLSQAVEAIRFSLYGQINRGALIYSAVCFLLFMALAITGYNPSRGLTKIKGG